MNTQEKIVQLTDKWYRFIVKDHHKDKDCHWYIEVDFAYGQEPTFKAFHFGYLAGDLELPSRTTYAEAEEDLLELIEAAIEKEREWVTRVLESPQNYEDDQIDKATFFTVVFPKP